MTTLPATNQEPADDEVAGIAWDLEPLVAGQGEEGVRSQLAEGAAAGLVEAMRELADLHDLVGRAGSYASLRFAVDTADPQIGALLQHVQERATAIQTSLLFFELEWAALPDERAEELLSGEGSAFFAHYLRTERRYRPFLLTEPEERILAEKGISGASA